MNEVSFDASAAETITLSVEEDFVAKQTTKSDPILALSELIWNSLDADALQIDIEFEKDDLANGLSKIIVVDNGSGFSREEARVLFKNLGGLDQAADALLTADQKYWIEFNPHATNESKFGGMPGGVILASNSVGKGVTAQWITSNQMMDIFNWYVLLRIGSPRAEFAPGFTDMAYNVRCIKD